MKHLDDSVRAFCSAETHDERPALEESGVLRRTLGRAQEIIRGLAQGNGELRKENQALWARLSVCETLINEAKKVVPIRPAAEQPGFIALLRDYREVVRQRDELVRELSASHDQNAALHRIVEMPRGFSRAHLARVQLEQEIERAEFVYASSQGAKSWVRETRTTFERKAVTRSAKDESN